MSGVIPKSCKRTYPVPLTLPTDEVCRVIRIPNDEQVIAALYDQIALLTLEETWEESETVLEWEMRALMSRMLVDFWNSEGCMIGAIVDTVREEIPDYWLICDGTTYQRVDYPKLYEVLASPYILNADEFITPDLRARVTIGENLVENYDPAFEIRELNEPGGTEEVQLIIANMPNHGHSPISHNHSYTSVGIPLPILEGELVPINVVMNGSTALTAGADANVEPTGGGGFHNNMQPYRVLKKVIVAK